MKALKIIGGLIGLIILAFVILIIIGPKNYHVERQIEIEASAADVWPFVSTLAAQNKWSPWSERDPNQIHTYSGSTDGLVGAIVHWEGNKDVGVGEQEITRIVENQTFESQLRFIEPFKSQSDAFINLEEAGGKTTVTWGFEGVNPIPWNAFMMFMNMEKAVGGDFEEGLANLKKIVMENPQSNSDASAHEVNEITYPGGTFAISKAEISMTEIAQYYTKTYPALMGAMQTAGVSMAGYPSGLYYTWDEETKITELAAAFPVAPGSTGDGLDIVELPAGPAVSVDYYGAYEGIGDAHMAIDNWLKSNGKSAKAPVIEEYVTDPGTEPDTSKWLSRVSYLLEE